MGKADALPVSQQNNQPKEPEMKTFEIKFTGRKTGAIGVFAAFAAQVFAENAEAATVQLYDRFEHIHQPEVKEILSPFDGNGLVERVQNTSEEHAAIRRAVESLRRELDRVAARQAQANLDWHDDPEAPDWALYHSPAWLQFPRSERDAAILELVSRHLDVLNENEAAAGKAVES